MAAIPVPEGETAVEAAVLTFANAVFAEIEKDLQDTPALTAIHWMLIQRAVVHFSKAVILDNSNSDRAMADLLAEPLRALRAADSMMSRLHNDLAKIINEVVPPEHLEKVRARLLVADTVE